MKRACKGKTKAGKRCKSPPRDGENFCISHSPKSVQAKVGFGGAENGAKGGAAKRVPLLTEILRARVEERADEIIEKLLEGLDAERAVVVGNGPGAYVEIVADRVEVLKTIREVFDRMEGRPKSSTEVTGKFEHLHRDQIDEEIDRLTAELASKANGNRSTTAT